MVKLIKIRKRAKISNKTRRIEGVFKSNNRLNIPLNLKENCALKCVFSRKIRPFILYKIIKRGVCVFMAARLCSCVKEPFCLFGHKMDTSIIYEQAKLACLIYM